MFGPGMEDPGGSSVIICGCGDEVADSTARELFSGTGALISHMDIGQHDELIAYVLGVSHVLNLLFISTLSNCRFSFDDLMLHGSTTFRRQVNASKQVACEDPLLYHAIENMNPHTPALLESMNASFQALKEASMDPDPGNFIELMRKGREYFHG